MKKITALLLALLLLVPSYSALALVKSMDILIDQEGAGEDVIHYVESATVLDGKLYLASYDGVFVWDGETGEIAKLTMVKEPNAEYYNAPYLVSSGGTLYNADVRSGFLAALSVEGDEVITGEKIPFDNKNLLVPYEGYTYPVTIYSAVLLENKLYLLTTSQDDGDYYTRVLHEIDLQTGKCEALLSGAELSAMLPYKDGNLLIKVFDQEKYDSDRQAKANLPALTVFDTKQKKLTDTLLTPEDVFAVGFAYDEKTDSFYMVAGGQLFRQPVQGEAEFINYIMNESHNTSAKAMLIGSEQYVLADYSGIYIRSTNPDDRPSELIRVAGIDFSYTGKAGYQAFTRAHPDIAVTSSQDIYLGTAEAFYQDFLSTTAGDIYTVSNAGTLDALIKKGYCLDLSGSSKLMEAVQSMYPHMTRELLRDGKLYAVPLSMSLYTIMGYSPSLFEQIGIAEADVPDTISEFMDFLVDWVDHYQDEYPDLDIMKDGYETMRTMILSYIFSGQLSVCQKEGIPVTFDTPEMRALLKKLDEVSPIISDLDPETEASGGGWYEADTLTALLDPYHDPFSTYHNEAEDYKPLLLGFADDIPMLHMASMTMLMVNPNTKNPEMAIALLEALVEHMEMQAAFMLYPDRNEPLENPYYQQNVKEFNENMKQLEEMIAETTDELFLKQLQESVEANQEWYTYLQRDRYAISPETIAFYRSIAENVFPTGGGYAIIGRTESLQNLLQRYVENQIPTDQYIKETEKILKMIYLENQ